jgi:hypothetical protein
VRQLGKKGVDKVTDVAFVLKNDVFHVVKNQKEILFDYVQILDNFVSEHLLGQPLDVVELPRFVVFTLFLVLSQGPPQFDQDHLYKVFNRSLPFEGEENNSTFEESTLFDVVYDIFG